METAAEYWKQLTVEGNRWFLRGQFRRAIRRYLAARDIAVDHLDCWPNPDDAVAVVVVSFLNLAEALTQTGSLGEAGDNLCLVHRNLLVASQDPSQALALRQAALKHLRQTLAALHLFARQHGETAQIAETLDLTRQLGCDCPAGRAEPRTLH